MDPSSNNWMGSHQDKAQTSFSYLKEEDSVVVVVSGGVVSVMVVVLWEGAMEREGAGSRRDGTFCHFFRFSVVFSFLRKHGKSAGRGWIFKNNLKKSIEDGG